MSSIVNLRTGLGPVLSLFGAKDRWTSPLLKARTVPTLVSTIDSPLSKSVSSSLSHVQVEWATLKDGVQPARVSARSTSTDDDG